MLVLTCPGPFAGGAAPFVPTDIAGLLSWHRGSSLSGNDGDPIGQWNDESGGAHHLTQGTPANKPLYRPTGGPNSLPCADFDGTDILSAAFTVAWPTTVFVVLNQTTWVGGRIIFDGNATSTMGLRQNSATPNLRIQAGSSGAQIALTLSTWGLMTVVFNATGCTMALNGNSDTATSITAGSPTGFRLGAADVYIAEALLYNSVLSSDDQAKVKTYLNTKYSLW